MKYILSTVLIFCASTPIFAQTSSSVRAVLKCEVYKSAFEDGNYLSQLIAYNKSPAFRVGEVSFIRTQLPESYGDIGVHFVHTTMTYRELGTENKVPYLQASFRVNGRVEGSLNEVSFELKDAKKDSKIQLRGVYTSEKDESFSYLCYLLYL